MEHNMRKLGRVQMLSEEGNGNPLQYCCLGNPMDRGVWPASPWGHKRVRQDLEAIQQQQQKFKVQLQREFRLMVSAEERRGEFKTLVIQIKAVCSNGMELFKMPVSAYTVPQFSSVAQSCPTLCDPMGCSTPGLPVHHQLPELAQIHVLRASDTIQPSHPLSSPSPPTFNLSQHQSLFQ